MPSPSPDDQPSQGPPALRHLVWQGLKRAHARRPASFYMLLATPLVLYLAVDLFRYRDDPKRFAVGLILLFVFLGIGILRALMDVIDAGRRHVRDTGASFRETINDQAFMEELKRARSEREAGSGEDRDES